MTPSKEAREAATQEIEHNDYVPFAKDRGKFVQAAIDKALASTPPTPPQPMGESGLLPCPFCGSNEITHNQGPCHVIFQCHRCGNETWINSIGPKSIGELWNTRTPTPAPTDKGEAYFNQHIAPELDRLRATASQAPTTQGQPQSETEKFPPVFDSPEKQARYEAVLKEIQPYLQRMIQECEKDFSIVVSTRHCPVHGQKEAK